MHSRLPTWTSPSCLLQPPSTVISSSVWYFFWKTPICRSSLSAPPLTSPPPNQPMKALRTAPSSGSFWDPADGKCLGIDSTGDGGEGSTTQQASTAEKSRFSFRLHLWNRAPPLKCSKYELHSICLGKSKTAKWHPQLGRHDLVMSFTKDWSKWLSTSIIKKQPIT